MSEWQQLSTRIKALEGPGGLMHLVSRDDVIATIADLQVGLEKEGRVLSSVNQAALQEALSLLQSVLTGAVRLHQEEEPAAKRLEPVVKFEENGDWAVTTKIVKFDEGKRTVLGPVLPVDTVDLQDDFIREGEIYKAMESFMVRYQQIDVMHDLEPNEDLHIVQCYQAPFDGKLGGESIHTGDWLMSVMVNDPDVLEKVKKGMAGEEGGLTGFSIYGRAVRVKHETAPSGIRFVEKVK